MTNTSCTERFRVFDRFRHYENLEMPYIHIPVQRCWNRDMLSLRKEHETNRCSTSFGQRVFSQGITGPCASDITILFHQRFFKFSMISSNFSLRREFFTNSPSIRLIPEMMVGCSFPSSEAISVYDICVYCLERNMTIWRA